MIRLDNTMRYMAINVITGENTGWAEDIYELHMRIAEMLSGGKYPKVARYRTDPKTIWIRSSAGPIWNRKQKLS